MCAFHFLFCSQYKDLALTEHVQAINTFSMQIQDTAQDLKKILDSACTYAELRNGQTLVAKSRQVY